jgi:hypothetical protein
MQGLIEFFTRLLTSPGMAAFVNDHDWAWPVCEMFHFSGMSLILGIVGLLDLRILGFAKGIPPAAISKLVPVAIIAFVAVMLSGLVVASGAGPEGYMTNLSFQLKMGVLLLAGLNLAFYYFSGFERRVVALPAGADAPVGAKVVAVLSLTFWVLVIFFGRMLMYNDTLLLFLGI